MLIEYPITANYMSHWTIRQATRELLQNAIDSGEYIIQDGTCGEYVITNRLYKPVTLDELTLLGETDKHDNSSIGRFGEGFKLAMLVYARCERQVDIVVRIGDCYIMPRIINNRFCLEIEKAEALPDAAYFSVSLRYLGVEEDIDALLLRRHQLTEVFNNGSGCAAYIPGGKLFVGGMFVCNTPMKYSYNFHPSKLKLDRDRNSAPEFELGWETTKLWAQHGAPELAAKLAHEHCKDVQYLNSHATPAIRDAAAKHFAAHYGAKTILAQTPQELLVLQLLYPKEKIVYAGGGCYASIIGTTVSAGGAVSRKEAPRVDFKTAMREFYERNRKHMRAKPRKEFELLLIASVKT
jgi:hypothetical protein